MKEHLQAARNRGEAALPTLSGSTQVTVSVGFSSFSTHVFDMVDCIPQEYFCAW
jgi:hypothetical protein